MQPVVNLFWFRRDLRINDNTGLRFAQTDKVPIVPIFIFDRNILDELDDPSDRRVEFIFKAIENLQEKLLKKNSTLDVRYGFPNEIFAQLLKDYKVSKVFTNIDYEPYATARDKSIADLLQKSGIPLISFKDQVIMDRNDVLKDDGKPYTIFTPYSKRWKSIVKDYHLHSHPSEKYTDRFFKQQPREIPSLPSMKFKPTGKPFPSPHLNKDLIKDYSKTRDIPSINGTSRMGIHLRFGTVSIRKLAREASALNETYLNELIWREFYQMILFHFPQVVTQSFKKDYDKIRWRNNEKEFDAWCNGQTGYPIVDAGMRELNETGFMHNRVRMITASFLTKHLLIDWRWGEAYFAKKLLDYDLASNNGGWQWAAGTGCDAAPYFRIFNPYLQTKKFDPDLKYIRKWVPEFEEFSYPRPIVDHEFARKRALEIYGKAVKEK